MDEYTDEEIIIIDDFRADSMQFNGYYTTRPLSQHQLNIETGFIQYRLAIA